MGQRIGFIGVGHMGRPMAANLLRAGFAVTAFDATPHARSELETLGATWAEDAASVAAVVDTLITMLPGPREVDDVLVGSGRVLENLRPGATWIDMSTSSPAVGRRIGERCAERDVRNLDAPVSGMAKGAVAGTLQIFVGGDRECFLEQRPLLEAMGDPERIFHVGPHGAGYSVKLLINLLWFAHAVAAAEVMVMGEASRHRPRRIAEIPRG